jgi:hypothetical protein
LDTTAYHDNPDRAIKSLFLQVNEVPDNNYAILKASFKYETNDDADDDADDDAINPTLEAYLPIPIKHHTCLSISGPTEVLYDH